jgi:hypothetical protein
MPLLAAISFTVSGCWDPKLYEHCRCFDEETHVWVSETIYDRKCSDETYAKNRKAGYERWYCERDTTSKKKTTDD